MTERKGQSYFVLKLLLVVGGILGVLLLVQSVGSYLWVSERMVDEALYRESARHASHVLQLAREADVRTPESLKSVFDGVREERKTEIAWLRLTDRRGESLAVSGTVEASAFSEEDMRRVFDSGERVFRVLDLPDGRVFAALRPFRFGFAPPPGDPGRPPPPEANPAEAETSRSRSNRGPRVLEIGLYWKGADPVVGPLRSYTIVSVSAALALLGAMLFIGLRSRNYVRGKQLEQQMDLARSVQQDLLPRQSPSHGNLEVAALCDPAWQVGGDFYDVFQASGERVAIILGDVSGKGLPAALLMSMLYGAIRSTHLSGDGVDLKVATRRLNELIHARTAVERFVTMFWCSYDPREQVLYYVNAGHLAPYIVHRNTDGSVEVIRLEDGGPVLGVIPQAEYDQGVAPFREGDLFILYSDGIAEALNETDEEFGEARIEAIIRVSLERPVAEIRDEILRQVRDFVGDVEQQDDLTLLIVRSGAGVERREDSSAVELQTA